MRIPVAANLESRDGGVGRDAKVVNAIIESRGQDVPPIAIKRPGCSDSGLIHSASSQLLYNWNGVKAILGDSIYSGTPSTIIGASGTALSPTNTGLQFSAAETNQNAVTPYLMFKNRTQAWVIDRSGNVTAVTYASTMGAGTYTLISLTRSGTTATATLATDPGFGVGDSVTIAGASPSAYNGAQTITSVTPGSFTPERDIPITSLTRSGTTATATATAHGLTNGHTYTISGASQSAYNGSYAITVVDANTFTYTVTVTPAVAITWNPSDKNAAITLSGSNLIATFGGAGSTFQVARNTVSRSSGKWYWEVTVGALPGGVFLGIADSSATLSNYLGFDAHGWSYAANAGLSRHNAVSASYGSGYTTGDVIGHALDMDLGTITFYRNGVSQGQAFSGITGAIFPAVGVSSTGGAVTVNFGATAFAHTVPTGYSAFQYDDPVTPATGTIIVADPAVTVNSLFTFTIGGSPTTPATGTITAQGNGGTVPGIPYIDGYFNVMDINGVIWSSAQDDPTTWGALDSIIARNENGAGKALGKSLNYLIAFKEYSTEYFFDNQNPTGSPFSAVDNGFIRVGCASGDSVAQVGSSLCWVSQLKAGNRGVWRMDGLQPAEIGSPDIDRIVNSDDLGTVYAYGIDMKGHPLYLLTLVDSNITLVYDLTTNFWTQWSSLTVGSSVSISSIARTDNVAVITTSTPHGLSLGDAVKISGANQSEYNGTFQVIFYGSTTTFAVIVATTAVTPATGTMSCFPYTESYFKFTKAMNYGGSIYFLHETNGHLYQVSDDLYRDAGAPINFFSRTARIDGGMDDKKRMPVIRFIGDQTPDIGMVRYSDDDSATFSSYRPLDLSILKPEIRKLKQFRRRSVEFKFVGNNPLRAEALEIK